MFEVILHRRAARYFQRLDPKLQGQLRTKFEALGRDPLGQPGIKPMAGEWDGYHRLRHGSLRVIFTVDLVTRTVVIAHIGPRGDIYK